jgi:hypothetical protein
MSQQLTVIFDGEVLRPEMPLNLLPNARYVITIEQDNQANVWDLLETMSGTVDAPTDWASEHDHYLYGTPKNIEEEV